ncbi:uncharacterized protein LOC142370165 isoform X2 [Odontesthes bonariensis]
MKRRCHQPQTTTTYGENTQANRYQRQGNDGEHKGLGHTKEMTNSYKPGCNARHSKSQKNKSKNGKRTEKHQQYTDRSNYRNGPVSRKARTRRDVNKVKTKFMTQEFKEQNGLLVNGRLICRHFLRGRCIKANDCQLDHVQGHNDLIKDVCKFYVQGACSKGESCPYMHKSFPCKFFHRKGKCFQGEDCKFSHEPLDDVTEQLLDKVLKIENDRHELAKKTSEESSVKTEESETTETNGNPEIVIHPLRPSFYNCSEAEKETSTCQTEASSDATDVPVSDAAQPPSPPSTPHNQEEPVCYSVEAVLGPQLSRPFPSFFTTPGTKETTFGQTSTPRSAQTVSYAPKITSEEISVPLFSSQKRNGKVSLNKRDEVSISKQRMYKSLPSLRVSTGLTSKTYADHYLNSGDHKKLDADMSECQEDVEITSHKVKPEKSASSESKGDETLTSQTLPTKLKPHLCCPTFDSQSFRKPFPPSLAFKELKGRAAGPIERVSGSIKTKDSGNAAAFHRFAAKQFSEIHQSSKKRQSNIKPSTLESYSSDVTPEARSKMSSHSDLSVGCNKTLSASLLNDSVTPASDSVTAPASPQAVIKSEDVTRKKTSATSFLSLFATPLVETPASFQCLPSQTAHPTTPPCSQQSVENTSSIRKQRAPGLKSPVPRPVRKNANQTSHRLESPKLSLKNENDPEKHLVTPVCSLMSDCPSDPSTIQTVQQLPDITSSRDSAVETSSNSFLKTLFLSLKPYKEDGDQQHRSQSIVHSESEKKSGAGCALEPQQKSERDDGDKKNMSPVSLRRCSETAAEHSAEHRPSSQIPKSSSVAAGALTVGGPGLTQSSGRNSGTHTFPFKRVTPLMQHHTRPRAKHASEEGGNVALTPFKDLFKTLDTSVFHLGH